MPASRHESTAGVGTEADGRSAAVSRLSARTAIRAPGRRAVVARELPPSAPRADVLAIDGWLEAFGRPITAHAGSGKPSRSTLDSHQPKLREGRERSDTIPEPDTGKVMPS